MDEIRQMADELQILFEEEDDRNFVVRAVEMIRKLIGVIGVTLHNTTAMHELEFDILMLDVLNELKNRLIDLMRVEIDR